MKAKKMIFNLIRSGRISVKKRIIIVFSLSLLLFGCGSNNVEEVVSSNEPIALDESSVSEEDVSIDEVLDVSENDEALVEPEESHEGMYRSELTNEWIDEELKDQRPMAVMVDNEIYALPHYGLNKNADVVYEIMNSTANGRITRLMVLVKDWKNLEQFGSVRSVRPTNFMLAAEYNAVIIHDGGPFYINEYLSKGYVNHLSGGFARFSNGKATEFTEYVTSEDYYNPTKGKSYDGLIDRMKTANYSETYNDYYPGEHFTFSEDEYKLSETEKDASSIKDAKEIDVPFPHNSSRLVYNDENGLYEYYEYGEGHVDPLDDNKILGFKNVIIYPCPFKQLDQNGYLVYHVVGSGEEGYYITNGEAIPITWSKAGETELTVYKNKNTGEEITLNTGKTYIGIVPSDAWGNLSIN